MATNALIPLQTEVPNVGGAFSNALLNLGQIDRLRQQPMRNKLLEAETRRVGADADSREDQARITSFVTDVAQLEGLPPAQRRLAMLERKAKLLERDPNADTSNTDVIISALESGDDAGFQEILQRNKQFGVQSGILKGGDAVETFTEIFDDDGNPLAQKNDITGEFKKHPNVSPLLSQKEVDQKIELIKAREVAAANAQAGTPIGQAALEANNLRIQQLEENIATSRQEREQKTTKQKQSITKAKSIFAQHNSDLDKFISLSTEIAEDPDLDAVTGPVDNFISLAGSKNADLRAKLKRLQALSAFGSLIELKAGGGTLGAISATELELLSNVKAAINTKQSVGQLKSGLLQLSDDLKGSKSRLSEAFNADFGEKKPVSEMTDEELQQEFEGLNSGN